MVDQRSEDQTHLLVTAARMYYERGLSQEEIATELGRSRPTISRLLSAARERGIVHIDIRVPLERSARLERALAERFGLKDTRVVMAPTGQPEGVDHLGRAAANYLHSVLHDGMTIGISNGRALASTAKYLEPERSLHLTVVQIIGAMGSDNPAVDGPDIARAMATAYDAQCRYLHVPILVEDAAVKATLVRDRNIAQTLKMGSSADLVLVGVGTLEAGDRSPIFDGLLTQREIALIRQAHGVGHIAGEHYSAAGERLDIDINDRTIGIGLDALKKVPNVVAVAGGSRKAPAIVAGIRGGYLNTLITDDRAAERILQLPLTQLPAPQTARRIGH